MEDTSQRYYIFRNDLITFKGYPVSRISLSEEMTKQKVLGYDIVKVAGWKNIKNYQRNHSISGNCDTIKIAHSSHPNPNFLKKNDIILSVNQQDKDCIAMTYIDTEPPKNIILNETAVVARAKGNSDVDMDYIYIMLQTAPIQNALLKLINAKDKATPKLSTEMLKMIHIIKLTEEERTKIVEEHRRIQEETIRFQNTIDNLQTTDKDKSGMIWVNN